MICCLSRKGSCKINGGEDSLTEPVRGLASLRGRWRHWSAAGQQLVSSWSPCGFTVWQARVKWRKVVWFNRRADWGCFIWSINNVIWSEGELKSTVMLRYTAYSSNYRNEFEFELCVDKINPSSSVPSSWKFFQFDQACIKSYLCTITFFVHVWYLTCTMWSSLHMSGPWLMDQTEVQPLTRRGTLPAAAPADVDK